MTRFLRSSTGRRWTSLELFRKPCVAWQASYFNFKPFIVSFTTGTVFSDLGSLTSFSLEYFNFSLLVVLSFIVKRPSSDDATLLEALLFKI